MNSEREKAVFVRAWAAHDGCSLEGIPKLATPRLVRISRAIALGAAGAFALDVAKPSTSERLRLQYFSQLLGATHGPVLGCWLR